LLTSKYFYNYS